MNQNNIFNKHNQQEKVDNKILIIKKLNQKINKKMSKLIKINDFLYFCLYFTLNITLLNNIFII